MVHQARTAEEEAHREGTEIGAMMIETCIVLVVGRQVEVRHHAEEGEVQAIRAGAERVVDHPQEEERRAHRDADAVRVMQAIAVGVRVGREAVEGGDEVSLTFQDLSTHSIGMSASGPWSRKLD